MNIVTLDYETFAIQPFPDFPPKPVGVAVEVEGGSIYLAWGHPTENNCTPQIGEELIRQIWADPNLVLLFHNGGGFDIPVTMKAYGLPYLPPERWEDTLFLLYLLYPQAPTLSLKPSAERLLNMPAEERDAVRQWLVDAHIAHPASKTWGEHIAKAPGDLVGTYAKGDVLRTTRLFQLLYDEVKAKGMLPAYEREKRLAPIFHQSSMDGMRIDRKRLSKDTQDAILSKEKVDRELGKILGESVNLDSGAELAKALLDKGKAEEANWPRTPTGKLSTARDALLQVIKDKALANMLAYRGALSTCISTFMGPWLSMARHDSRLHPSWNQVRGDAGGTRTGRPSCYAPNLLNVPVEFEDIVIPKGCIPLPFMRSYFLPEEGHVFVSADFHSQEIRMLGHFAEGAIQQIYRDNPSADIHQMASEMIHDATGHTLTRKQVKIIAFSLLYGAGVGRLADGLGVDRATAATFKRAYLNVLTGVEEYMEEVEARGAAKEPVRTWGGRLMHAPDPVIEKDGRIWNKDYVLVNYHIQGSAADQTKEAIVNYIDHRRDGMFLVTVYDEICISAPKDKVKLKAEIGRLREAMEAGEFELPMRADIKVGPNWKELTPYA